MSIARKESHKIDYVRNVANEQYVIRAYIYNKGELPQFVLNLFSLNL